MLDESTNPQPTDPPTGTGGNIAADVEEIQLDEADAVTDPPTGTGGTGGTSGSV